MKVQLIDNSLNLNSNSNSYKSANKVSFQGCDINLFLRRTVMQSSENKLWHDSHNLSRVSGISTRSFVSILRDASKNQYKLLKEIVDSYHVRNWTSNIKNEQCENPQLILDLYKIIDKPNETHLSIIKNSQMSLEELSELFKIASDKERLSFVNRMQNEVMDGSAESAKKIISLLESPYSDNIVKDFSTYKSFFKLYKDSEDISKILNQLLAENKFDKHYYDAKLSVKRLSRNHMLSDFYNKNQKFLEENYSPSGFDLMYLMADKFLPFRKLLSDADYQDILNIYKSTTPKNLALRQELMLKYKDAYCDDGESDIRALRKLYDAIDIDNNVAEFISKAINGKINADTIQSLLKTVELVPPKKLNIFYKNIINIYNQTSSAEDLTNALLKDVENPFYTSQKISRIRQDMIDAGFYTEQTKFQRFQLSIENMYNQLKYKFATRNSEDVLLNLNAEYDKAIKPISENPEMIDFHSDYTRFMPKVSNEIKAEVKSPVIFVRTIKESPQARKLRVTSDINGIIERKLGEKTLEKQKGQYAESATVMRLKLLNDIFDSIAVTRKQQRANGLRPNIENRDAIKVFNRINGKNKKLVRYMLRQTNGNNERIYNLKDIIAIVDNAEAQIAKNKKADKSFKAADAKAYYENIYQSLVQEHGKLKRKRKI